MYSTDSPLARTDRIWSPSIAHRLHLVCHVASTWLAPKKRAAAAALLPTFPLQVGASDVLYQAYVGRDGRLIKQTRHDSIRLKITYESSHESSYLRAKTPHYSEYHSREEEVGLINQSINHAGLLVVGGYAVYIIAWNSCQAPYRSITGVKRPMKRQAFRV